MTLKIISKSSAISIHNFHYYSVFSTTMATTIACICMVIHVPSRHIKKNSKSPVTVEITGLFVWWGKVDSNHRSQRQQIYSLLHGFRQPVDLSHFFELSTINYYSYYYSYSIFLSKLILNTDDSILDLTMLLITYPAAFSWLST